MTQVRKPGQTNIKSVESTFYENAIFMDLFYGSRREGGGEVRIL
jgi:hypothetical protein